MKIFISWSGNLSRQVADILRNYLPCMIQGLEVFTSQHDLESGGRWSLQLAKELEDSNFGIICLTPDNLAEPWILFEAGALTKHISGRACGLLLNQLSSTDVSGPLAQFQNCTFSKNEFRKLIEDINGKLEKPLEDRQVSLVFEKWWPDIEKEYNQVLRRSETVGKVPSKRDQRDLLEEVLTKVRSIERTLITLSPREAGIINHDALAMIDEVYRKTLNQKQQEMLRDIHTEHRKHVLYTIKGLSRRYSEEDVKALIGSGLVQHGKNGCLRLNPLVAEYLTRQKL